MQPDAIPASIDGRERFRQMTGANASAMERMDAYLLLLTDWSSRMNLVGPSALADFWDRHALDSAQLLVHAPDARVWADIGAGAGLPGLVLAILLKDRPGVTVHLIESMAKRCAFLRTVSVALNLPTQVHNARAESLKLSPVDVVTARACAPLPRLLEYARPLLRSPAVGLFLKGKEAEIELADARKTWRFTASLIPSVSGTDGRIIRLERLCRV